MPDPNKLAALQDLGYLVQGCCGICENGRFVPGATYGSCMAFSYDHKKHGKKKLSVYATGRCYSDFKVSDKKRADIARSGFGQFCNEDFEEDDLFDVTGTVARRPSS